MMGEGLTSYTFGQGAIFGDHDAVEQILPIFRAPAVARALQGRMQTSALDPTVLGIRRAVHEQTTYA